jgi:hypothetical protein
MALVVLALAGVAAPAAGGEPEPEAAVLLREGVRLRKAHADREALAAFEGANELAPSPVARAQIGLARAALADWLRADEDLGAALSADDPWVTRNRAELDAVLGAVGAHLGWLQVEVGVAAARATLDGRPLLGTRTRVVAGPGRLEVRAPGYAPDVRTIDVCARETTHVLVSLTPITLAVPVKPEGEVSPAPPAPLAALAPIPAAPSRPSMAAPSRWEAPAWSRSASAPTSGRGPSPTSRRETASAPPSGVRRPG